MHLNKREAGTQAPKFAVVPKKYGSPFAEAVKGGCLSKAAQLEVECLFAGPFQADPEQQFDEVLRLLKRSIQALALAPVDGNVAERAIEAALHAGIPAITFDTDAPNTKRVTYVGSDNVAMGIALADLLRSRLPSGGKFAISSGGPGAANLNQRVNGIRARLSGSRWVEVNSSPKFCSEDYEQAVQNLYEMQAEDADLAAIISVGGWQMFVPDQFKAFIMERRNDRVGNDFAFFSAGTLPEQVQLLQSGFAAGLVGQRPYEIGERVIDTLKRLSEGQEVPDPISTGLEVLVCGK